MNDSLRQELNAIESHDPIPFFCECGRPDCHAAVWLTTTTFDEIRAAGRDSERSEMTAMTAPRVLCVQCWAEAGMKREANERAEPVGRLRESAYALSPPSR